MGAKFTILIRTVVPWKANVVGQQHNYDWRGAFSINATFEKIKQPNTVKQYNKNKETPTDREGFNVLYDHTFSAKR